ncbi:MAG: tRNA (guanosine(46)-N7)-methyltransferase TrmB [Clostridia bacterium]|nr:tRNA (guanosine(46)-N7)-methyltransferase TrmB [Clostridia bacterium]MBP5193903.1 tRNA (guanosine(46)-N7)-methyltransferase TrmB [Clostridia bacterium]
MRMRKKRHMEERLGRVKDVLLLVEGSNFYERSEEDKKRPFIWSEVFGNDNPVEVEIGCGKGQFIFELAKRNQNVNFVAVEQISNVLLTACERAEKEGTKNVRFLNCDAYNLLYYFTYPVARKIYLNFSTPYPQRSYAGKRLTNPKFIGIYSAITLPEAEIALKTDSAALFEYSLETFSSAGYALKNVTLDLHASRFAEGNIVTEYERNFSEKGLPIYSLTAVKRD